jgi:hypothetical protein
MLLPLSDPTTWLRAKLHGSVMILNLKSTTNYTAKFYLHLLKYQKIHYDKIILKIK